MKVAIIGAGASGCFCAISLKRKCPQADIHIFESSSHPLAKLALTGGGRCNLTNSFREVNSLSKVYPRGEKFMKCALRMFGWDDTMKWFKREGINLKIQDDQRVFPCSDNAMEIVGLLRNLIRKENINLHLSYQVSMVEKMDDGQYKISFADSNLQDFQSEYVVISCGGMHPRHFLRSLGLDLLPPVPSLFAINLSESGLTTLAGITIEGASVAIAGTKYCSSGNILITHWGLSGPCILKLSSYAARFLADNRYKAPLRINWMGESNDEIVRTELMNMFLSQPRKHLESVFPHKMPNRLWRYILGRCNLKTDMLCCALNTKQLNRLVDTLTRDVYMISGQSRNKEEFVTCGGVSFSNVNIRTLECIRYPHLYFTGEILDIDAVTGGFNLQAAWTSAFVAADSIAGKMLL